MKKLTLIAALCATSLFGTTAAWAGDTANVAVSATITGTCKFNSGGSIGFTLDQTLTTAATGVVTSPAFWCTKGTNYTVTDNLGANFVGTQRKMKNTVTPTELINYTFSYTATGAGTGKTTPITLTLTGATVANADYVNAAAGSYADTVVMSITP